MYERIFYRMLEPNRERKRLEEPTDWRKVTKYYLFYGDIRTNTLKKMYILAKGGFVFGFWIASTETYILPHPLNPAAGTVRFLALSFAKRIPVGIFAALSFGAYWYAWNTYFDSDSALGVIIAANAAWATSAGPVLKKWNRMYSFMPWAICLGVAHLFPVPTDLSGRRSTQIKISNPHHYELDIFGNHVRPLTGINYDFDDDL